MTPPTDPKIVAAQIRQFAQANLVADGAELNEDSPLADAGIDSFALVDLLLHCERAFGIRVPESHLTRQNLVSVAALAACICELASGGHSPPAGHNA